MTILVMSTKRPDMQHTRQSQIAADGPLMALESTQAVLTPFRPGLAAKSPLRGFPAAEQWDELFQGVNV